MKKAAVKRTGGAADRHHQRLADALDRLARRQRGDQIELAEHRLRAALHVDPVIAVADRLVERGQLLGVRR